MSTGPVDLAELRAIHDRFAFDNAAMIHRAAKDIGSQAFREVRDLNQQTLKQRSGAVKASWYFRTTPIRGGALVTLATENKVAMYHEGGTGLYGPKGQKYLIKPKKARCLAFEWKGGYVRTSRVMHPGVKARHLGFKAMYGGSPINPERYASTIMRSLDAAAKRF